MSGPFVAPPGAPLNPHHNEVVSTSEPTVAAFALLVAEELRDPSGARVLVAVTSIGDLTSQEARDALRVAAESLVAKSPLSRG